MEGGGVGGGEGGMPPESPSNLLDAGAQAYYPAVGVPYQFHPPQLQLYCPQPYPLAQPPPPLPMVMSMPVPVPVPVPVPTQQLALPMLPGYPMTAGGTVVDGPVSRGVVLSLVPPHATEADVAHAMSFFGAVRAVETMGLASDGVATVHYFDLRAAELAVSGVREQHMRQQCRLSQLYATAAAAASATWPPPPPQQAWDWTQNDSRGLILGQAVWAHFAAASTLPDDGASRGSLVVLNSLPDVSLSELRDAFQAFGDLKDVRESAQRPNHKFVEFFDTRDAASALMALNGKDLFGHRLVIEFTRPSGPGFRRRAGYVPRQPIGPTSSRLQAAWRPTSVASSSSSFASGSGSGTGKARECVELMRRSSVKSIAGGDHPRGGGTSHVRRGKGRVKTVVTSATSSAASWSSTTASTASGKHSQKGSGRVGSWRGQKGGWEARFEFKEPDAAAADDDDDTAPEPASSCSDTRTTVMIRNIPNKYSQKLLLNMLDTHCIGFNKQIAAGRDEWEGQPFSSYDFLYLPIDFNNKCNVGYGFVNLTSPEAAVRLYKAFHKQPWEVYNSRKICQVTYARVQGLEALKEHFKNSKFPCDSDEYLPSVFSPPRDGSQLTEPVPLVPRSSAMPSASPPPKSVDPLALELMAPPSSSGDGASSTTMSTHADNDGDGDDESLGEELRRLCLDYTD